MRAIADDLALAQCPVSDEDLLVYILTQLGEEYNSIISAVRVREKPLSLGELADVLTDYERQLKDADDSRQLLLATANATQRTSSPRNNRQRNTTRHETKVCRKLARFLKEHNVLPAQTSSTVQSSPASPPWLFDSGASHHATSNLASLQTLSEYSGPDEVRLGDDNSLQISHIGRSVIPTLFSVLALENVLHVPQLHTNLVSISKLCQTNHVSVEFFGSHFLVKDLRTGTVLLK
ncbi:PREDICTED: uncharacterized protein LOC109167849 [Ipomoea nil]|uniref:uncharacterized protein LOC109167849 n=1 Tax=Ipomoea nil TaxID=35883 RepID=UPI000901CF1B|nr:PREDICTED: uncharacterized protein LOC109167849 [Ipomoea nil]